jgi:hypothetical protein
MTRPQKVRETSRESYRNMPHLSEDQQSILVAFNAYPDSTDMEIADRLGYADPNRVRPRRYELVELGFIINTGKRVCKVSKKKAMIWKVNPNRKPKEATA